MKNTNLTNSNAVNQELTARILANGANQEASAKANSTLIAIAKYKLQITAIALLALIPTGVIIAKVVFHINMDLD